MNHLENQTLTNPFFIPEYVCPGTFKKIVSAIVEKRFTVAETHIARLDIKH